jgi:hypothetical protein
MKNKGENKLTIKKGITGFGDISTLTIDEVKTVLKKHKIPIHLFKH